MIETSIKLGVLYPLSGAAAGPGRECLAAARIAKDLVNGRGGVRGRQVEFVVGDVTDPAAARQEAEKMIDRERVLALMGTFASALSLAATEVAEERGIIYWEQNAASDLIMNRGFKNTYQFPPQHSRWAETSVAFCKQYLVPALATSLDELKIAVIGEDSVFGSYMNKIFEHNFARDKSFCLDRIAYLTYSSKSIDLSTLIMTLKEFGPDIIIASSYQADSILFITQARQLGLYVKAIVGQSGGYSTADFSKALGKDADGIFVTDNGVPTLDPKRLTEEAAELQQVFLAEFKQRERKTPSAHATVAFGGTYVFLTRVLANVDSLDSEGIRGAIAALDIPLGGLPAGYGARFDERGLNQRSAMYVRQWQHFELPLVWPENMAQRPPIHVPLPSWEIR